MLTATSARSGRQTRPLDVVVPEKSSGRRWPAADLHRWRTRLEALWRRTVDEIVATSLALYEAAPPAEFSPEWQDAMAHGGGRVARLRDAVLRLHEARAEIEAAIERISSGRFGQCQLCSRAISADVLAALPQVSTCRVCALS